MQATSTFLIERLESYGLIHNIVLNIQQDSTKGKHLLPLKLGIFVFE